MTESRLKGKSNSFLLSFWHLYLKVRKAEPGQEDQGGRCSSAVLYKGKDLEMKMVSIRAATLTAMLSTAMALTACSSDQAIDNTVGFVGGTTRVVAKGAVGAGKLVYRGGKAVVSSDE
jgi:hypothetical protein